MGQFSMKITPLPGSLLGGNQHLWELENRDTRKPSGEKLTRIAQALEVTTDYLLDDSEEPSDEVLKEAFFRKFSKLDPEDQQKINQMIDMWGKKD